MATVSHVLRTSPYYYLLFVLVIHGADSVRGDILSVGGAECSSNQCRYVVRVPGGSSLRLTPRAGAAGEPCGVFSQDYDITEQPGGNGLGDGRSTLEVVVPVISEKLYFCRYEPAKPLGGRWIHQGVDVFLDSRAVPVQNVNASEPQEAEKSRPAPVTGDGATQNVVSLDANEDAQVIQTLDSSEASITKGVEEKRTNDEESNKLEVKDNLIRKEDTWIDLSHDTDVNNEPGALRPTREEAKDILVLADALTDQYVPLSEVNSEYTNVEDEANSVKENYGTNDYNVDELDIRLPKVEGEVKKIKELGAVDRDVEPLEQDNTVIDLIETVDPNAEILDSSAETLDSSEEPTVVRERREAGDEPATTTEEPTIIAEAVRSGRVKDEFSSVRAGDPLRSAPTLKIEGIRVEESDKTPENNNGIPSVQSGTKVTLRVFGTGLTEHTILSFTQDAANYSTPCEYRLKGEYPVKRGSLKENTALFEFVAPEPVTSETFYFCAKNANPQRADTVAEASGFVHQGSLSWVTLMSHIQPLPLWARLILILMCLMFSALFSGLNLGLMSLDRTELKIIANTGSEQERKYARAIQPVRDHGNYLLCSILLGNVAVNATFTILLDELMSGLFAVIFSTLAIVCLGEIVPQAICSRHGLMIGARSIVITKAVMGMTAPLAYPVSKMLDYFLGEEIGNVYNRERLKELVKVTNDINDLDKDEVNIISGALELRKKTVTEVMTKIEDVFMLSSDSVLDFETMSEIIKSGFSRIPVFEGARNNIVTVLFIKDLAFVDPDDNTPLRTLCQFYQNPCNFVFEDTTLDVMFRQFKEGHKGHMAFVHRVNNEGEGDPFYETVGLVTLEDVIEEMIQAEIVDETDVFTDNRSKRRRNRPINKLQDFGAFAERRENQRIRISPQLTLATFQFLGSTLDAFRPENVSETVLRRLLRQDIIHQIKCKGKDKNDPSTLVYTEGKPVDYFVLILEGRVEVTVGRENLVFEAGPFTYFGVQALTQNVGVAESPTPSAMGSLQNINMDALLRYTFVPDYSVRAITELFYITIKRSLYLAAKRATLMEKTSTLTKGGVSAGEQFDSEVDKSLVMVLSGPSRQYIAKKFQSPRCSNEEAQSDSDDGATPSCSKLLQSLDEDGSVGGDSKTPTRQISPNLPPSSVNLPPSPANPPPPSSASHQTRSSFASAAGTPTRAAAPGAPGTPNNGDVTYKFPPSQQIETDDK